MWLGMLWSICLRSLCEQYSQSKLYNFQKQRQEDGKINKNNATVRYCNSCELLFQ